MKISNPFKRPIKSYFTRRSVLTVLLIFVGFPMMILFWANYRIESMSEPYVTSSIEDLPKDIDVAIVPGTIKKLKSGFVNQYFQKRIDAAADLYKSGRIKHFLVSGDHSRKNYNESNDMRESLIEAGIPDSIITMDYAGFDTYDSMIRAKEVFGQDKYIIVSQEFQNERAVYIARNFDIEAWGYNAGEVTYAGGIKTKTREFFARGKAYVEVFFGVKPTFLGKKEILN